MCLSTVYKNEKTPQNMVMSNVQRIDVQDDQLLLTDLMDREMVIVGKLLLCNWMVFPDGLPEEYQILGKIINGDNVGRANEEEFVISSSHGIAISDVALGNLILEYANKQNAGTVLPFMKEADIIF